MEKLILFFTKDCYTTHAEVIGKHWNEFKLGRCFLQFKVTISSDFESRFSVDLLSVLQKYLQQILEFWIQIKCGSMLKNLHSFQNLPFKQIFASTEAKLNYMVKKKK